MLTHKEARAVIAEGFRVRFGREGTRPELQCVQGVGYLESGYSSWWGPPGAGSFNFGAIQGVGPAGSFRYTDSHPNPDGSSTLYKVGFRKYNSLAEGAADLVRVVYQMAGRDKLVLPFATKGDTLGFSTGMRISGYYEGVGRDQAERIANHHKALMNAITLACREIGDPLPDGSMVAPPPPPPLRLGSSSLAVRAWQRVLQLAGFEVVADGFFGPKTLAFTKRIQSELGLKADGIVGVVTQAAAAKRFVPSPPISDHQNENPPRDPGDNVS